MTFGFPTSASRNFHLVKPAASTVCSPSEHCPPSLQSVPTSRLVSRLSAAVRLCQRSAGRLPDERRRRGWFALLERAVAFQQTQRDAGTGAPRGGAGEAVA